MPIIIIYYCNLNYIIKCTQVYFNRFVVQMTYKSGRAMTSIIVNAIAL